MLRNWKFWAVIVVVGIGVGVGGGWVTVRVWAGYHAGRLLSADQSTRDQALEYWGSWRKGRGQRLIERPPIMRAVDRRFDDATDPALMGFFGKFHFPRYMDHPAMPHMRPALHAFLERNTSRPLAYAQDLKYPTVGMNFAINGMYPEMEPHFLRMIRNGDVRLRDTILHRLLDIAGAESEAVIARMLDDPDPAVARHAWLGMAFLDPISGHAGNWEDAPDGVAEAILYAAVATSDRPEIVLARIDAEPGLRERFHWLRGLLERAAEVRAGVPSARGAITPGVREILDSEYLFSSGADIDEASKEPWRLAHVSQLIAGFGTGDTDAENALRWLFADHPLPRSSEMSERQRAFGTEILRAWWAVHDGDYAFDEDAEVFRPKTNKAPE